MRFLSIQSHVTYGHVGNAAVQFPLQLLGVDVLPIHTALLSSHKGYEAAAGPIVPPENLTAIVDGLAAIDALATCDAVLSGYLGSAGTGSTALYAAERVKAANPAALYCCDPVIGDRDVGKYVSEEVLRFFRDTAIAAADIITPNQYELGILAGRPIRSNDDVADACADLRRRGPQWILVTSLHLDGQDPAQIEMQLDGGAGKRWAIRTPFETVATTVKGTGDLVAAVFTARLLQTKDPRQALEDATARIFAVVSETARADAPELVLVSAQDAFRHPARSFQATPLE